MDLPGWSSDMDISLLNGWNENNETNSREGADPDEKKDNDKNPTSNRGSPSALPREQGAAWDSSMSQWPTLSEIYEAVTSEEGKEEDGGIKGKRGAPITTISETTSMTSMPKDASSSETDSGRTSTTKQTRSSAQRAAQLHPQAIQSSANCPPHSNGNRMSSSNFGQIFPHPSQQSHQGQNLFGLNINQALIASNATALAASLHNQNASSSTISESQNLSSLATSFILAQNKPDTLFSRNQPQTVGRSSSNSQPNASRSTTSLENLGSSSSSTSQPQPPPFYLFDAPIELRANYIQNQRRLGIPIQHDCNSYHYGEAVKGFHPQHLKSQQGKPENRPQQLAAPVKLIDARHGPQYSGRAKNEREQKRAQKITELIDQLRENMEDGGWKVEMKSKYHTLSSCTEYIQHMVKSTKEKEETVNMLKADLSAKEQKREEEKAQESRSDPESVMSSLTSSTTTSSRTNTKAEKEIKRKADNDATGGHKKHRTNNTSSVSTNEDSSGEDRGSHGPSANSISIDKTVSSVSDLTDSNRGSSSNNSGSGSGSTEHGSRISTDEEERPSSSSISSDAAVASERSSRDRHSGGSHHHGHKDVVFNNTGNRTVRMRPPEEITSLQRNFELDYEEVFVKSNIPQLIAATSGKIVAWNSCFLKASGLRKSEVERMTIFSLVMPNKLSNFFEIVAQALRLGDEHSGSDSNSSDRESSKNDSDSTENHSEKISRNWNYAAMTLPCIDFPAMKERKEAGILVESSLYVTITLMADKDPRKRCFHCTFTNCPGTNGALGSISPDLLESLFATSDGTKKRHHTHNRKYRRTLKKAHVEEKSKATKPLMEEKE